MYPIDHGGASPGLDVAGFLKLVFNGGDGYMCVALSETKTKTWKQRFFDWPHHIEQAIELIAQSAETHDVYVCAQLLDTNATRDKDNVSRAHAIHADLDATDPGLLLVKPSILVESSLGRYQAWWLLEKDVAAAEAEDISHRIYEYHKADGCDPCWERNHVLRVPGTRNHKYADKPVVRVVSQGPNTYRISDFAQYPALPSTATTDGDLPEPLPLPKDAYFTAFFQDAITEPPVVGTRSDRVHWFMNRCAELGLSVGQIITAVYQYPPALSKESEKPGWVRADLKRFMRDDWPKFEKRTDNLNSWLPIDLTLVASGKPVRVEPKYGMRTDGICVLYSNKEHAIVGETEAAKSWVALMITADLLLSGLSVTYVDFEDDETTMIGRLLEIGVPASLLINQALFRYVRPSEPISSDKLMRLLDNQPKLVVFDGVTEAYGLHAWKINDNDNAADYRSNLIKPCLRIGAATLSLDHVVKDSRARNRYGIGAGHKMNGLNGAQFSLVNLEPFGIGRKGVSAVYISKDRPGYLRTNSVKDGDDFLFALFVGDATSGRMDLELLPPVPNSRLLDKDAVSDAKKVYDHIQLHGRKYDKGKEQLRADVGLGKENLSLAIAWLTHKDRGLISVSGKRPIVFEIIKDWP